MFASPRLPAALFGNRDTRLADIGWFFENPDAPVGTLPPIRTGTASGETVVPPSYVLVAVDSYAEGFGTVTEHGGGTLIAPNVVLLAAHVVTGVVENGFEPAFTRIEVSIAPPSRSDQPIRRTANKIIVNTEYEAGEGRYRNDLALIILDDPVPESHVVEVHPLVKHEADIDELIAVYGMGLRSDGSNDLHQTLRSVIMRVVEVRAGVTDMEPVNGQFEQGDSGGPGYDLDEPHAWMGVITHYEDNGGRRRGTLIPALKALHWGLSAAARYEADRQTGHLRTRTATA